MKAYKAAPIDRVESFNERKTRVLKRAIEVLEEYAMESGSKESTLRAIDDARALLRRHQHVTCGNW